MSVPVTEPFALSWRKASRSATNGECVEVATAPGYVVIRDSKNPNGAILDCSADTFRALVSAVKNGYTLS
jgi:Domain of unknown function (DUF397)